MLKANLLGCIKFTVGEQELAKLSRRKAGLLLAYLCVHKGQGITREHLIDVLWEDTPPADPQKALRQELWALRDAFVKSGLDGDRYLLCEGDFVCVPQASDVWVDVLAFETKTKNALEQSEVIAAQAMEETAELYKGEFLPGVYAEWTHIIRETVRDKFLILQETLLALYESASAWDQAITCGKSILAIDPLLESVHRAVMRCYYLKGSRAHALKQYNICKDNLSSAFTAPVIPMAETTALYESIFTETFSRAMPTLPRHAPQPHLRRNQIENRELELQDVQDVLRAADRKITRLLGHLYDT